MGNIGATWTRMIEEGESIRTTCVVRTAGRIHIEMGGDRIISGEPEAARRTNSEGDAGISVGSHYIPCFRWSTPPEAENQWTTRNGVSECKAEKGSNGSCTWIEHAPRKSRRVKKHSWEVLVAQNVCQRQRLEENVRAVCQESDSTVWQTLENPMCLTPMAANRVGYFIHAQNRRWVSLTSGSQGIPQRVGRGMATRIGYIGENSRRLS